MMSAHDILSPSPHTASLSLCLLLYLLLFPHHLSLFIILYLLPHHYHSHLSNMLLMLFFCPYLFQSRLSWWVSQARLGLHVCRNLTDQNFKEKDVHNSLHVCATKMMSLCHLILHFTNKHRASNPIHEICLDDTPLYIVVQVRGILVLF